MINYFLALSRKDRTCDSISRYLYTRYYIQSIVTLTKIKRQWRSHDLTVDRSVGRICGRTRDLAYRRTPMLPLTTRLYRAFSGSRFIYDLVKHKGTGVLCPNYERMFFKW